MGNLLIWLVISTPLKNINQLGLLFPIRRPASVSGWKVLLLSLFLACTCSILFLCSLAVCFGFI